MRALVVSGPRRARVQKVDAPAVEAGQLLVGVERVGIYGTDIELLTGEIAYIEQGKTHFPLRLGHKWTGRVAAVGPHTDELWIGNHITDDTMLGCGACAFCRVGTHWVCPDRFEVGVLHGWPVAFAERCTSRGPDRVPPTWPARLASNTHTSSPIPGTGRGSASTPSSTRRASIRARLSPAGWSNQPAGSSSSGSRALRASSIPATSRSGTLLPSASSRRPPGLGGAIEHFASGAVDPEPLVSETVGLDEVTSRLEGHRGTDAGPAPKVHVDPQR